MNQDARARRKTSKRARCNSPSLCSEKQFKTNHLFNVHKGFRIASSSKIFKRHCRQLTGVLRQVAAEGRFFLFFRKIRFFSSSRKLRVGTGPFKLNITSSKENLLLLMLFLRMFTIRYSKFDLAFLDNPFSVVLEEWVAGGGQVSLTFHFSACIEDIGIKIYYAQ